MQRGLWRCKTCKLNEYTSTTSKVQYRLRSSSASSRTKARHGTKKSEFKIETGSNAYPHLPNHRRKQSKDGTQHRKNLAFENSRDTFALAETSAIRQRIKLKRKGSLNTKHQNSTVSETDYSFYYFRQAVIQMLKKWSESPGLISQETGVAKHDIERACRHFLTQMNDCQNQYPASKATSETHDLQLHVLAEAYKSGGDEQVSKTLRGAIATYMSAIEGPNKAIDLTNPAEWYPGARGIHRQIHLHVGPTNSGKTYNALKRLESANSGWFAGPLRMLAHEVYHRLNEKGVKCNLVTGEQECIVDEKTTITSSTVEMTNINKRFEVGIIDEIQMIGDRDRGWAWTQAFLGLQVDELHLCGAESCVPIIQKLASAVGDKIEVHRYKRLGLLKPMQKGMGGDFSNIQQGDCVVTFSRRSIFQLRTLIEGKTGYKCAVVYGTLPPEVRAEQARLFNDANSGYNVMVASDAVGMGLNLDIKRIVFNTLEKFDGSDMVFVEAAQIKQISGRAGRFATSNRPYLGPGTDGEPNVGLVTTMGDRDLRQLRNALDSPIETILSAGLKPPFHIVRALCRTFDSGLSLANVFRRIEESARTTGYYHLCQLTTSIEAAKIVQTTPGLTFEDLCLLCSLPVNLRHERMILLLLSFARMVAAAEPTDILAVECIKIEILDSPNTLDIVEDRLQNLEFLHREIMAFLWMSMRLPTIFVSLEITLALKERTENAISGLLRPMGRRSGMKLPPRNRRTQLRL